MSYHLATESLNLSLGGLVLFILISWIIKLKKYSSLAQSLAYSKTQLEENLLEAQIKIKSLEEELQAAREENKLLETKLKIRQHLLEFQKDNLKQNGLKKLRESSQAAKTCQVILKNYSQDEQGNCTNCIGVKTDVTEPKQAEIQRERFFTLSLDLLCIAGFDGYFKCLNPAWETTLGYSTEELISQPFIELIHPDEREAALTEIERLGRGQLTYHFENRYRTREGTYRWLTLTAVPYVEEGLIYAVAHDITKRKQTEAEIQQTRNFLQTMIDHLPLAVFVKDGKPETFSQIILWNKTCEKIFGISATEAIGSTTFEHFSDSQAEFFYQKDRETFARRMPLEIPEEEADSYSLGKRLLHTVKIPLYDEQDQPQYLLCISEDITERKRAEEALKKSEEQFRLVFQHSPIGIAIATPEGKLVRVNEAFSQMMGFTEAELLKRTCGDLTYPDDLKNEIPLHQKLLAGEIAYYRLEKRYLTKKGQVLYGMLHVGLIRDEQDKPLNLVGQVVDISEKTQAEIALRESEDRLSRIITTISDGLIVVNNQGNIKFINPAGEKLFGRSQEELLEQHFGVPFVDGKTTEIFIRHANQQLIVAEMRVGLIIWEQQKAHLISLRDITERKQIEKALSESEQRLESILNSIEDVVWSTSATTLNLIYLNPATERVYGCSIEQLLAEGNLWFNLVHPDDQALIDAHFKALEDTGHSEYEYRIVRPDGTVRWLYSRSRTIYDPTGKPIRFEGIDSDITERKSFTEQLQYNAYHDPLTSLPNRIFLLEKLEEALKKNQNRENIFFAVLFLDLDDFKVVNDSLGHIVGDQLLIAIAQRLKTSLSVPHTLARFGGDEFTILLEEIQSTDEPLKAAQKIHNDLTQPYDLNGQQVFISTSIGIALSDPSYIHPQEILRDADTAMYQAKRWGKGGYAVFDQQMHLRAVKRLHLEIELRQAIELKEFLLYYQPIVSLSTGYLTGFEALIRWQHPKKGLISPVEFIPIAEETGLIVPMGKWITQQACRQLKLWQEQYNLKNPLQISVNLSSKQLRNSHLIEEIDEILAQTGIDPSSLKLEITESMLMENVDIAMNILIELRKRNIELCLDDFGTGYSSLSYLHRFPVTTVKIDRSFVMQMQPGNSNAEIVHAIITLAHSLEMTVTAEGVETQLQLQQLQWLECEQAQGYFFSKPLPPKEAGTLIQAFPCWK
ncbi:PAS domain S-box protein [Gloeothece verrucosa]|uniref:Diguanylate cyclase/phosphodiesterase with PAS/PAC sensor(S) n=1 Tax=Gloeothece verrucosa (strain PCC 7822) TaxID=497965 RepID=E0U630_GLOV7|nr:PAS domain S-box protein [Gloeothece verrucosa]ADN17139.1 diguanylate cyclase/phosphodiesterase with PAS/PAC sensor(s) [Gloeothece verrucosa PCC 7822]